MRFRALDLFAGCGGFSSGLIQAGHQVEAAVEIDTWAADTYEYNHPNVNLIRSDIRQLDSRFFLEQFRGKVNIIIGGPPCQGFSVSGLRQYGVYKAENSLVAEYVRVVQAVEPDYLVMENVQGFTTATLDGKTKALAFLLEKLGQLGYYTHHRVLQAADFGIPQVRSRLFVIGSRRRLPSPFPTPTHSATQSSNRKRYLSVMEAIGDLPVIHAREGADNEVPYTSGPQNEFQASMREGSSGVYNHEAMKHSNRLVERFAAIPPGGSGYKLTGTCDDSVTVYKSNNQRLISAAPSLCMTANWQSSYIHPVLNRNLTVREAARIQTFPDTFVFKGKRAVPSSSLLQKHGRDHHNFLSQCHQVGNAVPPMLARQIFEHLSHAVDESQGERGTETRGDACS